MNGSIVSNEVFMFCQIANIDKKKNNNNNNKNQVTYFLQTDLLVIDDEVTWCKHYFHIDHVISIESCHWHFSHQLVNNTY